MPRDRLRIDNSVCISDGPDSSPDIGTAQVRARLSAFEVVRYTSETNLSPIQDDKGC